MALAVSRYNVSPELRPCFVGSKKIKGLFHRWYEDPHAGLVGIVEYENGNILKHTTKNIQFADSAGKFTEYSWGDEIEDVLDSKDEKHGIISSAFTPNPENVSELETVEVNDGK